MVFRDSQLDEEPVADGGNGLPLGTNTAIVTDYDMSPILDVDTFTFTRAPFNFGIDGPPLSWYATAVDDTDYKNHVRIQLYLWYSITNEGHRVLQYKHYSAGNGLCGQEGGKPARLPLSYGKYNLM